MYILIFKYFSRANLLKNFPFLFLSSHILEAPLFILLSHFSSFSWQLSLIHPCALFVCGSFSLSALVSVQRQTVDWPHFSVAPLHTVCGGERQLHCSAYFISG